MMCSNCTGSTAPVALPGVASADVVLDDGGRDGARHGER